MSGERSRSSDETRGSLAIGRRDIGVGRCVITLKGELDLNTAGDLRAEVSHMLGQRPLPTDVEIDLAAITFVDSLGLGTLVVAQRICAQMGVRLTVRDPSPFVAHLLEVSGFRDQLAKATS